MVVKTKYLLKNWKLIFHLLFLTKKFGVNNQWWSHFDCFAGISHRERLKKILKIHPMINQYRWMKVRAVQLGAVHPDNLSVGK